MKQTRSLKVQETEAHRRYTRKSKPALLLKGAWLEEAGFNSNSRVLVTVENGKITITPQEENPQ
jgi:hypothetical protein